MMKAAMRAESWMAYFFVGSRTSLLSQEILEYHGSFFSCAAVAFAPSKAAAT